MAVRQGTNIGGRMVSATRVTFTSWTTPERRLMPLALSLQLPAVGAFNLANPGFIPRARVTWGHEDADQWVEFDLRCATIVKTCSSMSLELYLGHELRSQDVANTAIVPRALTQGCSVLIAPAGATEHSTPNLTWTSVTDDVVADVNLGIVPPWAVSVSVQESMNAGPPRFAQPSYYGGITLVRTDATIARGFRNIAIDECWRKFASLGQSCMPGSGVLWEGQMQATGAPEVQLCFGIEV